MLRHNAQSDLKINRLKRIKRISFDTPIIGLYLVISPLDYAWGEIITSFSFINLFAVLLILVRLCKKDFWLSKPKNFLLMIIFYVYNLINILLFSDILFDPIFLLFGLCFFFVNYKEVSDYDLKFFNVCILLSVLLTLIVCFFNFDFDSFGPRFYLNFSRYVDPNYFTCGLIVLTAYLMHRINAQKTIFLDVFLLACIFIIILASGSRGGLLANLATILIYIIFGKANKIFIPILLFCVLFFVFLNTFKNYIPKWILDRFSWETLIQDQGSGRLTIWKNYWRFMTDGNFFRFLFGYGKKNQLIMYEQNFGIRKNPHNMFIGVLFNSGIIGLILLLFVLGYFIIVSIKNRNLFTLSLLSGLIFSGLTLDINVTRTFWVVLMIVFMLNFRVYAKKDNVNVSF